jgi:type VI secretion system protein ImpF
MAVAPGSSRLNPTLFDKLVAGNEIGGLRGAEMENVEQQRDSLSAYSIHNLERFNEEALRATVKRELAWLLNTTNFESANDLSAYPQVRSSVLNYGVPDLAGKALSNPNILRRAQEIRAAILAFEPRIAPASLEVEVSNQVERENSLTFVIHADVTSAVRAIPIELRTDLEVDTASVTVRE